MPFPCTYETHLQAHFLNDDTLHAREFIYYLIPGKTTYTNLVGYLYMKL